MRRHPLLALTLPLLAAVLAGPGCECGGTPALQALYVSPPEINFGEAAPGSGAFRELLIENRGTQPLRLRPFRFEGSGARAFRIQQPDSAELPPGGRVTLEVRFLPFEEGVFAAELLVTATGNGEAQVSVPLFGEGVDCSTIACDQPPDPGCGAAVGVCSENRCIYPPAENGTACDDGDPCTTDDACMEGLCRGAQLSCNMPPGPLCTSNSSLTSWQSPGQCFAGTCEYTSEEQACAGGCTGNVCTPNPCTSMECNTAPACFKDGVCVSGSCQYTPDPGASCDDGDACTTNDACGGSGICSGTAITCNAPPSTACATATAQRVYSSPGTCGQVTGCSYPSTVVPCPTGQSCDGATGQCVCPAGQSPCVSGCCAATGARLAGGWFSTCAIDSGGNVQCTGSNSHGQLGDGTSVDRQTPAPVTMLSGVTKLAGNGDHYCALTSAGGLKCWGANGAGQVGDGTTTTRTAPVDVMGLTSGVIDVAGGAGHTCALLSGGAVKCWGSNGSGQIGDGTTTNRLIPTDVSGLSSGITAIALGMDFSCALTSAGAVMCWGENDFAKLGDGTTTDRHTPVNVAGLTSTVKAISPGAHHNCVLTTAGAVQCWGRNNFGQTGDGTTVDRTTPGTVVGLSSGATQIMQGGLHGCAIDSAQTMRCWGYNSYGQLGNGMKGSTPVTQPVSVTGLSNVIGASLAFNHTCARTTTGAYCWGWNTNGQIGDGTKIDRPTPYLVPGF